MSGFISNIAARLLAATGTTWVVHKGLTLAEHLDRSIGRRGRASWADLPRFGTAWAEYRRGGTGQLPIDIASVGSSVGNGATLVTPLTDAPGAWAYNKLMAAINPTGAIATRYRNGCVDGSTASQFPAAWAAILAAGYSPKLLFVFYNMNDAAPAQFNSGQTFPGYRTAMADIATTCHNAGCDVVFVTSPHASIVKNPGLYAMPAGIDHLYPDTIAKPVAPEAMQPPASQSLLVADLVGNGVPISVDWRMSAVNQAAAHVAREHGAALIDAEQKYFEALQKFQLQTGTAAGAEGVMFNNAETVHPNLIGHQNSYQPAIDEWVAGLARRYGQTSVEPRMNGRTGVNLRGAVAQAVFEVKARYADKLTKLISLSAQVGVVDANGIPAQKEILYIDQPTGDIVHASGIYGWTQKLCLAVNASISDGIERLGRAYGAGFRERVCGDINNMIAAPWTMAPFPDEGAGLIFIVGRNIGTGTSPQIQRYIWSTKSGVLTLTADGAVIGSNVYTVSIVGMAVRLTSIANNTNLSARWWALTA